MLPRIDDNKDLYCCQSVTSDASNLRVVFAIFF